MAKLWLGAEENNGRNIFLQLFMYAEHSFVLEFFIRCLSIDLLQIYCIIMMLTLIISDTPELQEVHIGICMMTFHSFLQSIS
jgi:hypothetical protein